MTDESTVRVREIGNDEIGTRADMLTSSRLSKEELTLPDLPTQEVDSTKTLKKGLFEGVHFLCHLLGNRHSETY